MILKQGIVAMLILHSWGCGLSETSEDSFGSSPQRDSERPNQETSLNTMEKAFEYKIESSLGLIVSDRVKFYEGKVFTIYEQSGALWYSFSIEETDRVGFRDDFRPFRFDGDSGLVALNWVGEDSTFYHVRTFEDEERIHFILKNDESWKSMSWGAYVLSCFAIEFDPVSNPLFVEPSETSKILFADRSITFHPREIIGEWLRVEYQPDSKKDSAIASGWVRWKRNGNLILRLFETS